MSAPIALWRNAVSEVAAIGSKSKRYVLAKALVREMPEGERQKILTGFLVEAAADLRRNRALATERAATVPARASQSAREKESREYKAELMRVELECRAGLFASISSAVDEFKSRLRLTWTKELLATSFSLPDGQEVTWGEASVEQHQQRVEMFAAQAALNIEGAARHRKAIEAISLLAAKCLNEIHQEAA